MNLLFCEMIHASSLSLNIRLILTSVLVLFFPFQFASTSVMYLHYVNNCVSDYLLSAIVVS